MTTLRALAIALCLCLPLGAAAEEPKDAVTPALTDKLRNLLQQEMQLITEAMADIYEAIVTGEHKVVAEKAAAVHESFVLKQNLTKADKQDLLKAVPKDFVKRDKRFHADAAELAEAARNRDTAAQLELFEDMTRQCAGCHARYVSDRFPDVTAAD